MLHRDFGPRSFNNSHIGKQTEHYPRYSDESGRIPTRADKSHLQELIRQKLTPVRMPERPIPEPFTNLEIGNKDPENPLPITEHEALIVDTVHKNPVTIIVAETGGGKSTQAPQFFLKAGYEEINMTQPRRLASRMVAERIADELEDAFGDDEARRLVGYQTAQANTTTEDTRITVLTGGIQHAIELSERAKGPFDMLICDEVHEWDTNTEIIIAWQKKQLKEGKDIKLVIMSATMDAQKLADYFADTGFRPPIIDVPGRTFGVEKLPQPDSTVFDEVVKYAEEENNILAFLPGVREIDDMKRDLEEEFERQDIHGITVLPLHGKLSEEEQKAVDREYPGPKIVLSTNVAQTSLTIKDIDVVIDSGLERRIEIDEEGVQSLRENAISQADCDQRAGRAGRTHAGVYVLTRMDKDTEFVPYIKREDYSVPEILRSDVDKNTLAVAAAGLDLSKLDLFHPVDHEILKQSRHRMQLLGGLDDSGRITQRGRRMNKFPVHPTSARMLIESDNYSDETRAYVAAVVSTIEVGKLPSFLYNSSRKWRNLTDEKSSEHLAQLDVFIAIADMSIREQVALGLDIRNVERARELYQKILYRSKLEQRELQPPTPEQRKEIVECVAAGLIDFVYESAGNGKFIRAIGNNSTERDISNRSNVSGSPTHIVGTPYGYEDKRKGEQSIIENVTVIHPKVLGKVAASLCVYVNSGPVKWRGGQPVHEQKEMFRGLIPTGMWQEEPAKPSKELRREVIEYVKNNPGPAQRKLRELKKTLDALRRRSGDKKLNLTQQKLDEYINRATPINITDPSLIDENLRQLMEKENIKLDSFASSGERDKIFTNSPDYIIVGSVELKLRYSEGDVSSHINDLATIEQLGGDVYLPDGRPVILKYGGKNRKYEQLLELAVK